MVQPAHLRGTAIFLNAPDNAITQSDVVSMKAGLWAHFIESMAMSPKGHLRAEEQGVLVAYMDRLLMGYRARVWNAKSAVHTAGAMFSGFQDVERKRLTWLSNAMLDMLAKFDSDALVPVWEVIDAEREGRLKFVARGKCAAAH
jgi:hypothetical protein